MKDDFFGMILAGGSGTRLWPISREATPKQVLSLSGSGRSLLQDAFGRLARSVEPGRIVTVTGESHADLIAGQIGELAPAYPPENLLAEPMGRDSAPAVLWGTLRILALDPEAVVALIWSDQLIRNEDAFDTALAKGYEAVRSGGLAVIGVPANRPATNLGYIRTGGEVAPGVYAADRFIEKPDRPTAEKLVAEGKTLWNPGVFVFKARTLVEEYQRLGPEVARPFFAAGEAAAGEAAAGEAAAGEARAGNDWLDPSRIADIYQQIEKQSIDYLVLEKTDRLLLIPAELEWSDLGTWDEVFHQAQTDEDGNALSGNVVAWNTTGTYVRGGRRLIATVGVKNLVIVDTDDALLICDMARIQDIKQLVEHLKTHGFPEAESSGENVRPWGGYAVLAEGEGYKVKVLTVNPRQKLSLQMHNRRDEHWVVVEGAPHLTRDGEVAQFKPNDYFYVPRLARHRIENRGDGLVRIVEVQQGDYLGEDDIVRFEDDYGRI